MPPNPLAKRMASPCAAYVAICDMQISKSEKNFFPPSLPNPGYAPDSHYW